MCFTKFVAYVHSLSYYRNGEYQTSEMKQMLMSFTRQVACGLTFLFLKQYVHRDLAARNILVSEDGICKVYIASNSKEY